MTNDKTGMGNKTGPPRLTLVPKNRDESFSRQEPASDPGASSRDEPRHAVGTTARDDLDHAGAEDAGTSNQDLASGSQAHETPSYELGDPLCAVDAHDRGAKLRIIEAVLFASQRPMSADELAQSLSDGDDIAALLAELQESYAPRGINLRRVAGKWAFRTAEDLSYLLQHHAYDERRLSKAALETLSIIAYHQPVTRAEIEDVRGVTTSSGTIDILLETGWIRPRGRRRAPGRPVTYGTTESFLEHFALDTIKDLPGLAELKGAGLLDANLPPGFTVPEPQDIAALMPDELPLEDDEDVDDAQGALEFEDALEPEHADEYGYEYDGEDTVSAAAPEASGGDRRAKDDAGVDDSDGANPDAVASDDPAARD